MAVRTRPIHGRAVPGRVRIRTQRTDPATAYVTVTEPFAMTSDGASELAQRLRADGHLRLVTNAMAPADAEPLLAAGFVVHERLALLARPLDRLPATRVPTRSTRRRRALVALDQRAFGTGAFDAGALDEAVRATPAVRVRITGTSTAPTGYAVTGVAGWRAYLQRLAVDPRDRRTGLATALVLDGLRWCRRRGARSAMVNTHVDNTPALTLYERVGFVARPDGLVVLERTW